MATERLLGRARRVLDDARRPVDASSLAVFRVAFGALLLIAVARHVAYGWVAAYYLEPRVFFPYPGLEWIEPLPAAGMYALYGGLAACAVLLAAGAWTRWAATLFCLGFTYVHLIDRTNYLNHYYLVSLLSALLVAVPAGAAWSVDAWRRGRAIAVPAWAVWLLRAQLGVVYAFGAIAKCNPDWLLRAEPLRLWLGANADLPVLGPWLEQVGTAYAFSYAGLLFDAAIAPLLSWRRTTALAYLGVLAFHLLTAALFPIGMFPWLMIALTPIFFAPDWPRRLLRLAPAIAPPSAARGWRWAPVAAALWIGVQMLVPLRHFAYDGDLYWHESGFRWSWQIMVMEKYGRAVFDLRDPVGGTAWQVHPQAELTLLQERMMATQPDMILSYAHHLAAQAAARLGHPVEVRADVLVTFNGRPHGRLVDPDVDLAALPDGAPASRWLLPHPDRQQILITGTDGEPPT
ncbi:HTTM domain-containing protein [bacterium]|nr:HTTM domain-containing protein [bacterium]